MSVVGQTPIVFEDFEAYQEGGLPLAWRVPNRESASLLPIPLDHARPNDFVKVVRDETGQVLQVYTLDETVQIALPADGELLNWDLEEHPRLSWRWKAITLPAGAREDRGRQNDSGGAFYVFFNCNDWLGRPCIIKYVYSSTLDLDMVARYGRLRVLVVSTALEGIGMWRTIERNVVEDYRRLFGRDPRGNPGFIMIWGDSDSTGGESEVYFDNLMILPAKQDS